MRRDATDPAPELGRSVPGPVPARVGRARRFRVNYGLAALIGVAMMGLAWFANLDSDPATPRLRLARGEGDPPAQALAFAFSPDGTTIATTHTDGRVALRSPTEGWSLQRLLDYRGFAWALAFSPDGRSLAVGGTEPDILLYDLNAGGAGHPLGIPIREVKAIVVSPDGRSLAASSSLHHEILLWDLAAGRERARL